MIIINNIIECSFGRLGKGKTLRTVMKTYDKFLDGREIFSNLPIEFKHTPIRTVEDFLNIENGEVLGDELWSIADNRKRGLLTDLATIFCLRSRKRNLNVRYTQQFLQIDVRIAYITNLWIKPCCYPISNDPEIQLTPEYMICKRWNSELEPLTDEVYEDIQQYFKLYDTTKDPYFIQSLIDEKLLKKVKEKLKDGMTDTEIKEYDKIVKKRGIRKLE